MLYMVEMDFRNPAREADWHVWYLGHVAKLIRNVPGFRASQRFRAITPTPSPWLAMHDVVSGAVFDSAEYRANGGPASTGRMAGRARQLVPQPVFRHRQYARGATRRPPPRASKATPRCRRPMPPPSPGSRAPASTARRGPRHRHSSGRPADRRAVRSRRACASSSRSRPASPGSPPSRCAKNEALALCSAGAPQEKFAVPDQ